MKAFFFINDATLSKFGSDDSLTQIQCWFKNQKLKLNADKSQYLIIRNCKIGKHSRLRPPEDGG